MITINIVDFNYPPDGDFHTCFHLREDKDKSVILTKALEIHFINMTKWCILEGKDLANEPLHRWLTWLDTKSPPEFIQEVIKMDSAIMAANERQDFVMQSEADLHLYRRRQKAILDHNSEINWVRREEREKAAELLRNNQLQTARNALAEGNSIEAVHRITGLSLDEIARL